MQNLTNLAFAFYMSGGFTPVENQQMAAGVVQAAVESFGPTAVGQVDSLLACDSTTWALALAYLTTYWMRFGDCDMSVSPSEFQGNLGTSARQVLAYMALWAQG